MPWSDVITMSELSYTPTSSQPIQKRDDTPDGASRLPLVVLARPAHPLDVFALCGQRHGAVRNADVDEFVDRLVDGCGQALRELRAERPNR